MIYIDRHGIPKPEVLASPHAEKVWALTEAYYDLPPDKRPQDRDYLDARHKLIDEAVPVLRELFRDKCAFCETPLDRNYAAGGFRPESFALNLDGEMAPDYYWWLALEWENLYLGCDICWRTRRSRFPVAGERASRDMGPRQEEALLLDPCHDNPEEYLVFSQDGHVASVEERGRVTIEVFGLNRDELVDARRKAYQELQQSLRLLGQYLEKDEPPPPDLNLEILSAPDRPFAGMRRQFVTRWTQSPRFKYQETVIEQSAKIAYNWSPQEQRFYSRKEQNDTFEEWDQYRQKIDLYSLDEVDSAKAYYLRSRFIERIELTNFKLFDQLTLTTPESTGQEASWLVLLGENSTGKSSVLQAVALALAGGEYRSDPPLTPQEALRHGTDSGSIRIFLTGGDEPIEVLFSRDKAEFTINTPEPKILILAYGATRLLPRYGNVQPVAPAFARIDNLFNPFVPLKQAPNWLLGLDEEAFNYVSRSLSNLLSLADDDQLLRDADKVWAEIGGQRVELEQLSDGYQSVLALATDIMSVMLTLWQSMTVAEGIVLIDEIGSHLHPRWQMRIVSSLRSVFPGVQFIVSTHNPLCLRGLHEGEIIVMRRDAQGQIVPLVDLPSPEGLRVDQLLISEHFGLNSTIDPEIEKQFDEYHELLAKRDQTAEDTGRIRELRNALAEYTIMGDTPREMLMLEAIDQHLANVKKGAAAAEPIDLSDKTRDIMNDMWADAAF